MSKTEEMYALMSAYESSGQSRQQFCQASGISLAKFGYWRSKWLKEQSESACQSQPKVQKFMRFAPEPASTGYGYEIVYPNGIRLRLRQLDLELLPFLLRDV